MIDGATDGVQSAQGIAAKRNSAIVGARILAAAAGVAADRAGGAAFAVD